MNNPSGQNINDSFFEGRYKEVWRQTIPPGLTEAEADFIEETGVLSGGQIVLDIMCGYGRHSLELARRGYQVTAIDNAATYIEEIRLAAASGNLPIQTLAESVLTVDFGGPYDAAICMGNSFAFFSEGEADALLQKIAASLKEGGKLIINSWMIAEIAIRHFKEREWHTMSGHKYGIENRFLFHPTRIESLHTVIPVSGAVEEIKGVDYIFTIAELQRMLQKAGFMLEEVYSTPRKKKFVLGDGRAYIVATRQAW
jgi:SAM-dependent methyltransferase